MNIATIRNGCSVTGNTTLVSIQLIVGGGWETHHVVQPCISSSSGLASTGKM